MVVYTIIPSTGEAKEERPAFRQKGLVPAQVTILLLSIIIPRFGLSTCSLRVLVENSSVEKDGVSFCSASSHGEFWDDQVTQ